MCANVMFVNDDENLRFLGKLYLEDAGHAVSIFKNKTEALAALENQASPDVIIVDQKLKGAYTRENETGSAFLKEARQGGIKSPAIIFTNMEEDEIKELITANSLQDVTYARVDVEKLGSLVESALKRSEHNNPHGIEQARKEPFAGNGRSPFGGPNTDRAGPDYWRNSVQAGRGSSEKPR